MKKQRVYREGNIVGVEYPTLGGKKVVCDLKKLTPEISFLGLAHGIGQKLGDAASGGTPQEKFEMATRIVENLYAGNWELTSEGDNGAEVIATIARMKKLKPEQVEKELSKLTDEQRDAKVKEWRAHPKVKAEIAKARAEKAQKLAEESDADEIEI